MVTELQFVAIAAFLMWCLVSSVCGVLQPDPAAAQLVWREHVPTGWSGWREVHYGLTGADLRLLNHPDAIDRQACDGLFDTVLQQARSGSCDAVQFAVIRRPFERVDDQPTVIFVSDKMPIAAEVTEGKQAVG